MQMQQQMVRSDGNAMTAVLVTANKTAVQQTINAAMLASKCQPGANGKRQRRRRRCGGA